MAQGAEDGQSVGQQQAGSRAPVHEGRKLATVSAFTLGSLTAAFSILLFMEVCSISIFYTVSLTFSPDCILGSGCLGNQTTLSHNFLEIITSFILPSVYFHFWVFQQLE